MCGECVVCVLGECVCMGVYVCMWCVHSVHGCVCEHVWSVCV